jgi:hypothetical protein
VNNLFEQPKGGDMKRKRCLTGFFLLALSMALTIHSVSFAAVPAIDQDEYGAAYIKFSDRNAIDFWIKVIDHDGIWYNSGVLTHKVYVEGPEINDKLYLVMDTGSSTHCEGQTKFCMGAFYGQIPLPYGLTTINGSYTFTVEDPEGNTATSVDNLSVTDPLQPVDLTSLNPNIFTESVLAHFDNVRVKRNGGQWTEYDNFANGIDPLKWDATYSNEILPIWDSAQVEMRIKDPIGMERCRMQIKDNPASVTGLGSDIILVNSTSPLPKARIAGNFFSVSEGIANVDIWSAVQVYADRIEYQLMKDYWDSNLGLGTSVLLYRGNLAVGYFVGKTVGATLDWDANSSAITFSAVVNGQTYTHIQSIPGTTGAPTSQTKRLETKINFDLQTDSPTFEWDEVPGATRYRIDVLNTNTPLARIWRYFTLSGERSVRVPPGVLKPYTGYQYILRSWGRNDTPGNIDEVGFDEKRVQFVTGGPDPSPYLEFDSTGVQVWNSGENPPYLTFWAKVYDPDGVPGNIKSVIVRNPGGEEESLYCDTSRIDASGATARKAGIYRSDNYKWPLTEGEYTFIVEDFEGHTYSMTDVLGVNAIMTPPSNVKINNVDAHGSIIGNPNVPISITWDPIEGQVAFYRVEFYKLPNLTTRVYAIGTSEPQLLLPAGYLKENTLYGLRVTARREFFNQNVDNGSHSHPEGTMIANVMTTGISGSQDNVPVMSFGTETSWQRGVFTWTSVRAQDEGPLHMLAFNVKVQDNDGVPGNIKSVKVIYPDPDKTRFLHLDSLQNSTTGIYFDRETYADPSQIPQGTYTFIVEDFDGHSMTLTDQLDGSPIGPPTDVSISPSDGAFTSSLTPTISWVAPAEANQYRVRIFEGWNKEIHGSPYLQSPSYTIPANTLKEGYSYSVRVHAFRETNYEIDNESTNIFYLSEKPQFTVDLDQDLDGDGIYASIDLAPASSSDDFSDVSLGGTTYGYIESRGNQVLTLYDWPSPYGVLIEAKSKIIGAEAVVLVCGDSAVLHLTSGDKILATCGSVKLNLISGEVQAELISEDGQQAADVTLSEQNSGLELTFNPQNFTFTAEPIKITPTPLPAEPIIVKLDSGSTHTVGQSGLLLPVRIDIKPGDDQNVVKLNTTGVLPVVIFGKGGFDVRSIDLDSLVLMGMNVKVTGKKSSQHLAHYIDVNGDGWLDLTVQFANTNIQVSPGTDFAILTGRLLNDETPIVGSDKITIVP